MLERILPLSLSLLPLLLFSNWSPLPVNAENAEYFTSVAGMEDLLKAEVALVAELQQYIDGLQKHIDELQSEVNLIREDHLTASEDVEGYINNPVNSFRLIRRLHTDWDTIEESVRSDSTSANFLAAMQVNRMSFSFPTKEDVVGSAVALARLQDTYQLDVAEVASGILRGIKYGPSMSWQDCFLLGHHLFELRDFNHTVPWLKQSVQMLKSDPHHNESLILDFLQTVSTYHQQMGDFETALDLLNYVVKLDETRVGDLQSTRTHLERMVTSGVKEGPLYDTSPQPGNYHHTADFKRYEKVCRGELKLSPAQERPLRCRYFTNNTPYNLLKPFKLEERYLDPYVVVIHDVFDARQTEPIKRLAKTRMARSRVHNHEGTASVGANYRISKSSWFQYTENRHMMNLLQQLGRITGLDMKQSEQLQVANYGIGGHYEPHFDFYTENFSSSHYQGNRLATGLFYLSDVEEGGGTAFPYFHLLVKPERGSVLFWYNLHPSEDPDYRTRHAACPVLKGSKWIGTIWVHVRYQDHARPCELTRGHEVSLKYQDIV